MPIGEVMSISAPAPPKRRQTWLTSPLSGAPRKLHDSAPSSGVT
jgi:hypothetical protein